VKLALAVVVGFLAGEVETRWMFAEGQTFSNHSGPLVRRFERDFRLNADGSRGPALEGGKRPGTFLVVVQGDSITWGQGVRHEADLYTSRLLERLRRDDPAVTMAVLARPGREIDGHLAELRRRGAELQPDLLIYQWFVNDMELDKSGRPSLAPPWHELFFHEPLSQYSYFWYFVDDRLGSLWSNSGPAYRAYVERQFSEGADGWSQFAAAFEQWAAEATRLSPRVLVVLYPYDAPHFALASIHERVRGLASRVGAASLDLIEAVPALSTDGLAASPYDPHPGPEAHGLMAEAIHDRVVALWGPAHL
jgi:lysophospholipase L1-like esterase